jgi:hypothetical protein
MNPFERKFKAFAQSKMMGHKKLKTTQIYAKVVDEKKRAAADKIKLDLSQS